MEKDKQIEALERRVAELDEKCERLADEASAAAEVLTGALADIEELQQRCGLQQ